ncbi:MAG: MerR family transcriptional regulator [Rhodobacteraceae bacterium]|nr:MAG: MerR family transcriptional regulator [Paracoccaceae bacterium]
MVNLFDNTRNYLLGDPELNLIGTREKLGQWRCRGVGPAYFTLGRKIIYSGVDLNAWANAQRVQADTPEAA